MGAQALIEDARGYTGALLSEARGAFTQAIAAVQQVGYTQLTFDGVPLPAAPTVPEALIPPELAPEELVLPADPGSAPIYQDIAAIEAGTAPTFSVAAPTITLPSTPAALAEFVQALPAVETSFTLPEPPAQLMQPMLDAPVIVDRVEPVKPNTNLPGFTATAPTDVPEAPTGLQATMESAYSGASTSMTRMLEGELDAQLTKINPRFHEQMGRIETQLATYLAGGTGISADVEAAIYERSRARNSAEEARVVDAAWTEAAANGFTMPNGTLLATARRGRQAGADNNAKANAEIVVMAAEMEQKNLQFAVTASAALRQTALSAALGYHSNLVTINGQALQYAKNVLDAVVETYNIAVRAFGVRVEALRAEALVYETRLKAAMAGIDLYRAEVAALEALTQVDTARLGVYRARIESLTALSGIYRTQVDAVLGRASLEKMKLDVFEAQVRAYAARVQAKNAEWQGYSAAIQGQTARAEVFASQVQGFNTQVQAYRSAVEAKAAVVRAAADTNEARARQYTATVAGYAAVVQARAQVASTKLENQRQEIVAFQAASAAQVANAQLRNEYYRSTGEIALKNAQLSIETIVKSADLARSYASSIAGLHTANAEVYGRTASSALAGMNSLASESLTA